MTFLGRKEVFPPEENVSNRGKGRETKGVIPDTRFPPTYPRLEPPLKSKRAKSNCLLIPVASTNEVGLSVARRTRKQNKVSFDG